MKKAFTQKSMIISVKWEIEWVLDWMGARGMSQ